ncbi:MAG TPA: oligosaccharide flippase family protein [Candidatus Eisenbacteria bacterium]|nr:oligosaccharide flippase family protein [Candidatus Eisenbacteria bacterium]
MTVSKGRTFSNILYTGVTKGTTLGCLFISSSVIARNLSPADYGVVGFAYVIIGFLSHFSDMGVGAAVISDAKVDERRLSTAFTLKIILSAAAFVAAYFLAPFAHHFFEHPQTANVIRLLALNFLVSTIGFLSTTMLTREMNYRALVFPGVASAVVRCMLVVTLIWQGWRYWAIIAADIAATLAAGLTAQLIRKVPGTLGLDKHDAEEYLRFGIPLFGSGALVFLLLNLDNFLVGAKLGTAQLGYYALAFNWASFICVLLQDTVNNVLLPTLSAIQNDLPAVRRWYLKTIDLTAFVAVVANATLLVNARQFLVTFLGKGTEKWVPAILPLEILCVYGILRAIASPAGNWVMIRGQTRVMLYANLLGGAVELSLLLLALRTKSIEMVAVAVLVAYVCAVAALLPFLRREFLIRIHDIVVQIWPVAPALVMGFLVSSFLPVSLGGAIFTLAARASIVALAVALTHGLCSRFRCFQEAGGMILQNVARDRA